MRVYDVSTRFVIRDNEGISEVVDKWLKENAATYVHPSCCFDIVETIKIQSANDTRNNEVNE